MIKIHFSKLTLFIACFLCLIVSVLSFPSCDTEGVKLSRDDRYRIDTLTNRKTVEISADLEKLCKDSTPAYKQYFIDSLMRIREQEALMQSQPLH